ncbi:hypothetical protein G3T14_18455 [Methylobacterium sp. BTF04]|uniref:hypothetical protein n=1 Tax=Methylobacterium sp. BTF04 TaxID=2708300 RepID=UPI0013D6A099|nr:hypothetical protein [Methylobacterium sp. BTF04]NEU14095.1 hypothetical protein [Methylobacterium sp. BTF04]
MRLTALVLMSSLALTVSGSAFAQAPAGGGSATGNMNNPGSVKSDSEKSMERTTGSATGSTMAPATGSSMGSAAMPKSSGAGAGNATTGSGAAPSGK